MGDEEKAAEPGTLGNPVQVTDPKMMRALAHQGRIAIWTYLGLHGLTATECAEIAGLSPSACSYHLRTLARYGFVEEDPASAADGRERPWRARMLAFNIDQGPGGAGRHPGRQPAAGREHAGGGGGGPRPVPGASVGVLPPTWQAAAGELFSVAHVTPEELQRMREQVIEVMAPYVRLDPDGQAGARPVRITLDLFPWFGPEEAR